MTENERLTFKTELGISIDKNEDCPTMSICWNCDIPPRKCNYFNDAIEKLAKYEEIGTVEELEILKEKNEPKEIWGNEYNPVHIGDTVNGLCPICNTKFVCITPRFYKTNNYGYCKACGQKLDWQ